MLHDNAIAEVMIIDDDEINNFLCAKIIETYDANLSVTTYTNPAAALQYLSNNRHDPSKLPDLIILDLNMPDIDGWGFLNRFRKEDILASKPIKVVILSSSVYQKDKEKAFAYTEISQFISKPFTLEHLEALMAS